MTTESVKPWEPVSGYWVDPENAMERRNCAWPWDNDATSCECLEIDDLAALRVTLANGQTVIVRAKQ